MGAVKEVNKANWDAEVLQTKGLVLVDFWAAWCAPCRMVAPILEELASQYEGRIKVVKLNTDENPEIASQYQIMGIPTVMFFRDGQPVDKVVGALPKDHYVEKIESLLGA